MELCDEMMKADRHDLKTLGERWLMRLAKRFYIIFLASLRIANVSLNRVIFDKTHS